MRNFGRLVVLLLGCVISVGVSTTSRAAQEIVFGRSGGFEFYSRPQGNPYPGFIATIVGVRTLDPTHTVGSIDYLLVDGNAHQTWYRDPEMGAITVRTPYRENGQEWDVLEVPLPLRFHAVLDTHLIPWCGPEAVCDPLRAVENNDGSNPGGMLQDELGTLDGRIDNYFQINGFGSLMVSDPPLSFVSGQRQSARDLAYVVTQADETSGNAIGEVAMTMLVVGSDALGNRLPTALDGKLGSIEQPAIGVAVPFAVPEPTAAVIYVLAGCGVIVAGRRVV